MDTPLCLVAHFSRPTASNALHGPQLIRISPVTASCLQDILYLTTLSNPLRDVSTPPSQPHLQRSNRVAAPPDHFLAPGVSTPVAMPRSGYETTNLSNSDWPHNEPRGNKECDDNKGNNSQAKTKGNVSNSLQSLSRSLLIASSAILLFTGVSNKGGNREDDPHSFRLNSSSHMHPGG